ncbi:acyl carrier protein [Paraburkholderia sp. Tr-20389]|uniref:acyl carrier protein n=1 Tax=Paraburkholderia sp. Tr-20389 TaxID=2703903 RepID=UPI00197E7ADF|nr:acyl carrier protein [Paraburkholderia sp. Tr-20389]MBN3757178.1 acyl carrier protein [Paraburkholderia sp. Tr-20389]
MQTNIEERVRTILAAQFCVDDEEIDLTANLKDAYEGDSLDQVEIVMCAEDEFGCEIPDDEMFSIVTGQQLIDLVTARV